MCVINQGLAVMTEWQLVRLFKTLFGIELDLITIQTFRHDIEAKLSMRIKDQNVC
jgi:hypothetical protein